MSAFTINVEGLPIPQGSMVSNGFGRGLRHSNHAKLKPWRNRIADTIARHQPPDWDPAEPLSVIATFRFPRPKHHRGTGRNADVIKDSAPSYHLVTPDLDKLTRALGDAITQSGLIHGDQQICRWNTDKRWCIGDEAPGVLVTFILLP